MFSAKNGRFYLNCDSCDWKHCQYLTQVCHVSVAFRQESHDIFEVHELYLTFYL